MLPLILQIFAFVCFVIAAYAPAWPRPNLIAAGLAFWVLSTFINGVVNVH